MYKFMYRSTNSRTTNRILLYFVLVLVWSTARGFPSLLLDKYCDLEIKEGVIMMKQAIVKQNSSHNYAIRVYRESGEGQGELHNGSFYNPNEKLLVSISPKLFSLVLESRGAVFENGQCSGKNRISDRGNSTLLMPSSGIEVDIVGCWTKSFSDGVKLLPTFTLKPRPSTPLFDDL